jgi:hypothetical protein
MLTLSQSRSLIPEMMRGFVATAFAKTLYEMVTVWIVEVTV